MTTGKLNITGSLLIERAGKLKVQMCKKSHAGVSTSETDKDGNLKVVLGIGNGPCGDDCPAFGEPVVLLNDTRTVIKICEGKEWIFDEFTDERVVVQELDKQLKEYDLKQDKIFQEKQDLSILEHLLDKTESRHGKREIRERIQSKKDKIEKMGGKV